MLPYFGRKRKLIAVGGVGCSDKEVCLLKIPKFSLFEPGLHLGQVMVLPRDPMKSTNHNKYRDEIVYVEEYQVTTRLV